MAFLMRRTWDGINIWKKDGGYEAGRPPRERKVKRLQKHGNYVFTTI